MVQFSERRVRACSKDLCFVCYDTRMPNFLKALRSGRVLLMDGAMGTQLQRAGANDEECFEALNLTQPEKIRAIHRAYVEAGAEVLLSNTFQANPTALSRHHQDDDLAIMIRAGLEHARTASRKKGWVLAAFGPLSTTELKTVWPVLNCCRDADGILLETFSDPGEAAVFARANQSRLGPNKPVLVSFSFDGKTLRTFRDVFPEKCAQAAKEMEVAALGINCGRDFHADACVEILRRYRTVTDLPLFTRLNAGTPNAQRNYPRSPKEMAAMLPSLLEVGVTMIGGCCGTTPQHIEAFGKVVNSWKR
jgi:5-methyltetrahydrofolate--homocysteine methyltransferase